MILNSKQKRLYQLATAEIPAIESMRTTWAYANNSGRYLDLSVHCGI